MGRMGLGVGVEMEGRVGGEMGGGWTRERADSERRRRKRRRDELGLLSSWLDYFRIRTLLVPLNSSVKSHREKKRAKKRRTRTKKTTRLGSTRFLLRTSPPFERWRRLASQEHRVDTYGIVLYELPTNEPNTTHQQRKQE